ncbi:outer membrane protein, multidrug efflux system [Rubritalea squalenifaciens DSM 18772]|uniref:Outer membrane protein, multidrug efflux system n=1 Tax=Rubritalea squalenifaciens DSM 18772 TaxID=1123071 RepID=A0A1M6DS94_9BACT|nr:efflux transporter outer membrane subunit [Rubritalea squalenifaciens]SHI76092.1 outer membrane protein, multidrug efflux system [Rubritalea squalenifaciens DSM 18772]
MKYASLTLASSLVLSSCVLGPDYKTPETADLPAKFDKIPSGWKAASPADHLDRGDWWKRLGDSKLNRYMSQVESANPNAQAALARLRQSRAVTAASRVALQPALNLNGRAGSTRSSENTFRSPQAINQQGLTNDSFRLPFDLTWEIDLWGRVRREQEAVLASEQSVIASYKGVILSLQADLAQSWFSLRATDSEIEVLNETLKLRKNARDLLANRVKEGAGSDLDLARSEAELASTEADIASLRRRRAELVSGIALILGKPAQGFQIAHYPLDSEPPRVPINLPSEVLERRPDISQAERNLAAASARIGSTQAALFPKIGIDASLGLASRRAADLLETSSKTWSYGLDASVPILRRTILKADVKQAEEKYNELLEEYRQTVLTALREVDVSLNSIKWLGRQQSAVDRQAAASKKAADLSNTRFLEGLTSLLEVIDAERTRLQASRAQIQVRNERYTATIQLMKALGGSYHSPSK